ncbi:hypothetical protein B0H19DRAFT_1075941 [Mycena capillaripes]|nr:hypothetical protein B0H19DRAFT_1075941 [Mycena capillaripes]
MIFKALSALVLAGSLFGATVASPMSELEAGLESRQSCGINNSACGSVLPACCSGLFCNTLNGRCGPCMVSGGACQVGVPCCAGFTCSALSGWFYRDAVKRSRMIVVRVLLGSAESLHFGAALANPLANPLARPSRLRLVDLSFDLMDPLALPLLLDVGEGPTLWMGTALDRSGGFVLV